VRCWEVGHVVCNFFGILSDGDLLEEECNSFDDIGCIVRYPVCCGPWSLGGDE